MGGARTGTMHARSCSTRTREATAASSRCALPTLFRSLDCQHWQVWAAGSSFVHFRGDLTRQVRCYTLPYRGWDWVPVSWGRSHEGQVRGGSVSFKRAFSPLPAPPPSPPSKRGQCGCSAWVRVQTVVVRLGSESQTGSNGCLWKHQ